jgi:hypothetical protein
MKRLIAILLSFFMSGSLEAAISYDNSSQTTVGSGNISYTLTVAANATYVFVGIGCSDGTLAATPSVTVGGTAATKIDSNNNSGWGWLFGIASPPTGSDTISITFTSPANTLNCASASLSLLGTSTAGNLTALDVHTNAGGAGDPGGGSLTANATTDATVDFIYVNGSLASNLAASNSQTIKQNINDSINGQGAALSLLLTPINGSNTLHYTNTNTNGWDWSAASIKVGSSAAVAGVSRGLELQGGKINIMGKINIL